MFQAATGRQRKLTAFTEEIVNLTIFVEAVLYHDGQPYKNIATIKMHQIDKLKKENMNFSIIFQHYRY